jgi:hypothetical protein
MDGVPPTSSSSSSSRSSSGSNHTRTISLNRSTSMMLSTPGAGKGQVGSPGSGSVGSAHTRGVGSSSSFDLTVDPRLAASFAGDEEQQLLNFMRMGYNYEQASQIYAKKIKQEQNQQNQQNQQQQKQSVARPGHKRASSKTGSGGSGGTGERGLSRPTSRFAGSAARSSSSRTDQGDPVELFHDNPLQSHSRAASGVVDMSKVLGNTEKAAAKPRDPTANTSASKQDSLSLSVDSSVDGKAKALKRGGFAQSMFGKDGTPINSSQSLEDSEDGVKTLEQEIALIMKMGYSQADAETVVRNRR